MVVPPYNSIKDSIWDALPLWNLRLRAKMCQVVHANVVEVLTLLGLPIDPKSERYHTLYTCLFCALVAKKITWKTSVLYSPPPVLLDSNWTAQSPSESQWSPSGVPVIPVESEWSPSNPSRIQVESQ